MNQNPAIFIIIIIVFFILAVFVIPSFMGQRAFKKVIHIFQYYQATNISNAKTLEDLGLKPRSFIQGMFKLRDYKPYALDFLMKSGAIQMTDDGKLYLVADRLPEKLKHMSA